MGNARTFNAIDPPALGAYRPQVLAGPVSALRELAGAVLDDPAALTSPDLGIIVLIGPGHHPPEPADRDLFWRAFQLPVFEQLRSRTGELLAWECEAHRGLHADPGWLGLQPARRAASRHLVEWADSHGGILHLTDAGLEAQILTEPCACGRPGARLIGLRPRRLVQLHHYAASA